MGFDFIVISDWFVAVTRAVRIDCFEMSSENIIIPVQRYVALFLDTNPCTAMSEGAKRQKLQSDARHFLEQQLARVKAQAKTAT